MEENKITRKVTKEETNVFNYSNKSGINLSLRVNANIEQMEELIEILDVAKIDIQEVIERLKN